MDTFSVVSFGRCAAPLGSCGFESLPISDAPDPRELNLLRLSQIGMRSGHHAEAAAENPLPPRLLLRNADAVAEAALDPVEHPVPPEQVLRRDQPAQAMTPGHNSMTRPAGSTWPRAKRSSSIYRTAEPPRRFPPPWRALQSDGPRL
jgi:hypothetical protein